MSGCPFVARVIVLPDVVQGQRSRHGSSNASYSGYECRLPQSAPSAGRFSPNFFQFPTFSSEAFHLSLMSTAVYLPQNAPQKSQSSLTMMVIVGKLKKNSNPSRGRNRTSVPRVMKPTSIWWHHTPLDSGLVRLLLGHAFAELHVPHRCRFNRGVVDFFVQYACHVHPVVHR